MIGILVIIFLLSICNDRWKYRHKRLKSTIFWNWPIQFITESYIVFVICCLINVYNADLSTYETRANTIAAIVLLVFLTFYPLLM